MLIQKLQLCQLYKQKMHQVISLPSITPKKNTDTSNQQQTSKKLPSLKLTARPWKWMVGILYSFLLVRPSAYFQVPWLLGIHPIHPIPSTLSLMMHPPGLGICSASYRSSFIQDGTSISEPRVDKNDGAKM